MANDKFDAKSFNPQAFKLHCRPCAPHPAERNPQVPCFDGELRHPQRVLRPERHRLCSGSLCVVCWMATL